MPLQHNVLMSYHTVLQFRLHKPLADTSFYNNLKTTGTLEHAIILLVRSH
jgi:hypothetical protein